MSSSTVFRKDENGIAWLTLSNPERRNAVTPAMLAALRGHLKDLWDDLSIRCIALRGDGDKAFSAGYDLRSFGDSGLGPQDAAVDLAETLRQLIAVPKPTVALLNGHAIGAGCEIAVTCDIRWAVFEATLGMPPAKLGLIYSPEGLSRFVGLIGPASTAELFYSAKNISAERAEEIGLVNDVLDSGTFAATTALRLREIAALAPWSHAGHAFLIRKLAAATLDAKDMTHLQELRERAFASSDASEGLAAFLEKRAPQFTGK
jgi:enoyl-CoA hydratase/carnithine racemase